MNIREEQESPELDKALQSDIDLWSDFGAAVHRRIVVLRVAGEEPLASDLLLSLLCLTQQNDLDLSNITGDDLFRSFPDSIDNGDRRKAVEQEMRASYARLSLP